MHTNYALKPESVAVVSVTSKQEILAALADLFAAAWPVDRALVLERLEEREALGSTGFGRGVAIPHARLPGIGRPVAALLKLQRPVDFDAADGLPVEFAFGLLSPEHGGAAHLHALASISRLVRDGRVHDALAEADDPEEIFALLSNATDRDAA